MPLGQSSSKYTTIKGSSGVPAEVNPDGQLHVVMEGKIDSDNTTITPLLADAVFTGVGVDVLSYPGIGVLVGSDVAGNLMVQYSPNNTDWFDGEDYDIVAGAHKFFSPPRMSAYYRLVYTNGITNQATFYIHPILSKQPFKWSSHNIDDPIADQDDAELVKAVITGRKVDGDFDNVSLTNGANMKISLEELETGISSNNKSQLNVTLFDEGGIPASVDDSTETLQVLLYEHHEIHEGNHYGVDTYVTLSINNVYDIQITTPDTVVQQHMVLSVACQSETIIEFFEDVTIVTPGVAEQCFNNNRRSANTTTMTINGISNTSTANANGDTSIAGASLLRDGIVGSGRNGGSGERTDELILKRNTSYSFRFTATAAGYIDYHIAFYEHTDKNP